MSKHRSADLLGISVEGIVVLLFGGLRRRCWDPSLMGRGRSSRYHVVTNLDCIVDSFPPTNEERFVFGVRIVGGPNLAHMCIYYRVNRTPCYETKRRLKLGCWFERNCSGLSRVIVDY